VGQNRQVRRQKQNVKVGINQTRTHFMGLPRHLAPDICVAIISGLVCAGIELVEKRQVGHNHSAIEDWCTGRLNQLREITSVVDNPFSVGIMRSNALKAFDPSKGPRPDITGLIAALLKIKSAPRTVGSQRNRSASQKKSRRIAALIASGWIQCHGSLK